jgi:hypothetical protein
MFNVELLIHEDNQVRGVRKGDRSLMYEFFCLGYCNKELQAVNILVQHFHNLLHISDIAKCDGHTLDKFVISDFVEELVSQVFPREEPTLADLWSWNEITKLCSGSTSLPYTLG